MTAHRFTTDAECIRNRAGSLPPRPRYNPYLWTFAAGLAIGAFCGFLAGLAA